MFLFYVHFGSELYKPNCSCLSVAQLLRFFTAVLPFSPIQ